MKSSELNQVSHTCFFLVKVKPEESATVVTASIFVWNVFN